MSKGNVSAILSADWHIRLDKPVCRLDDFLVAQSIKVKFILSLARKYKAKILLAGDLSHRPFWGDRLLNYFIDILKDFQDVDIYMVCGQHDLPNHRLDKWKEGGVGVLSKNGHVKVLTEKFQNIQPFSYGEEIKDTGSEIVLLHAMIIKSQKEKLWYDQKADHAKRVMRKLPTAKLILSGDNHQSFVVEHEGQVLVNSGSISRSNANQIDHKPSVYLWYAEDNTVERVFLPFDKDVIDRSHIDITKKRDTRIESFVNRLDESYDIDFNFEKNLEEFFNKNEVNEKTKEKIWESLI